MTKVFEEIKTVKFGEDVLEIHLANFIEADRLFSEILKCNQNNQLGIDVLQSDTLKAALLPCLNKTFFNNQPIKGWDFFDDVNNRTFYVDICLEVIDFNIKPFMSRLSSSSEAVSRETEMTSPQK